MLPLPLIAQQQEDVIVIGAGLSGLYAASLLEQAGLNVTVLEGSDRIGGRLYTLDDVPGKPEAGAQTIGPTYGRVLFTAMKLGVELQQVNFNLGSEPIRQFLHVGGERILPHEWGASPHNPFPTQFKEMHPDPLLAQLIGVSPFDTLIDWLDSNNYRLDIPVAKFLRQQGFNEASVKLMGGSNNYGKTLDETSLLYLQRVQATIKEYIKTPGGTTSVVGGNQRLPEAMAASLNGDVHRNKIVTVIRQNTNSITVQCEDGSDYNARHVISAVPFSSLRNVLITPNLPDLQAEAVQQLTYGRVFMIQLVVEKPFWVGKGFLPNVWSDSILERIFASDPQNTGQITNITIWINGKGVDRFDGMPTNEVEALTLTELAKILPESQGAVRIGQTVSWQKSSLSGGCYAVWQPGQVSRYANVMAKPAGNLHFAGEHTSQWMTGMEGAMESGERVAHEILYNV
jgi:monoamine oxidase